MIILPLAGGMMEGTYRDNTMDRDDESLDA